MKKFYISCCILEIENTNMVKGGGNIKQKLYDEQFKILYAEYYSVIYKYCMARLNCNIEYAEDCSQETFLVLYKKLKIGEEILNPRAFLYTTATNFIKKKYNELQRQQETADIDSVELPSFEGDAVADSVTDKTLLQQINGLLNAEEQRLFQLRFVEEQAVKDIAVLLQITPPNCSLKITRLRRKIIQELGEYC